MRKLKRSKPKQKKKHVYMLSEIRDALPIIFPSSSMQRGDNTTPGSVIPVTKPLLSEDARDRTKMGKDAKQLTGKLTGSTVMVWKRFNKLETISKMVDGSDADQRQRPAL